MNKHNPMLRIISLIVVLCLLGGGVSAVSEPADADVETARTVLYNEEFDVGLGAANQLLDGRLKPIEWTYSDKRVPATPDLLAGIDTEEKASGEASLCVQASNRNSVGFLSPKIPMKASGGTIDMELDVKVSSDYENNTPKVSVEFYNGERLLSSNEKKLTVQNGDWKHNIIRIEKGWYPRIPFDNIKIRLFTVYSSKNNTPAEGMIYFDNLKLVRTDDIKELELDVLCDDSICWYEIGETVTFKPQKALPLETTNVIGTVYNSYDEVVYTGEVTAADFAQKGWQYTTDEVGYYEVEFIAYTPREAYKLISRYVALKLYYTIPRRSFVVATPTKPMEERNDMLYGSFYEKVGAANDIPRDDAYRMHDVIGFRGLRNWFPWEIESFKVTKPVNPGKGIYYWDEWDAIYEDVRRYGFDVMATIIYTPKWASTYADTEGTVGTTKVATSNIYEWAIAPPTRLEYYTDYLEELAERYGDCIDRWEIWNEMNPASRFWEHGTVDEYVELLKVSREKLNEIQPGDEVIMGGLVGGAPDYWAELLKGGIYDYTDAMVVHGSNIQYNSYLAKYEELGLEEKPYYNNEAHYYITNTYGTGMDFTDRDDAMRILKGYLHDFSVGCEFVALFQVTTNKDKEELPEIQAAGQRGLSHGLWRRRPIPEPKLPAKVLHTFFDVIGKEFKFDSQYTFDGGDTPAMVFNNDGEKILFIWNESSDFKISDELKKGLSDKTEIIDWEGRPVGVDDLLHENTMYFVKGVNPEAFKANEQTTGYLASSARKKEKQVATEVGYANANPVFNKNTFALAKDITWIDTDWNWNDKGGTRPKGYDARMAVSVDEEGLYLLVEVDDPNPVFEFKDTDGPSTMYNSDSVQFAVDVSGMGYSDMRVEMDCSILDGKPTLYKRAAANVNGAIPAGWSTQGSEMNAKNTQVTAKDGKITYKIFVPLTELYPFKLEDAKGELRLSIVVNECDGKNRQGLLRWSSGIDSGKYVGKYGKIILP